MSVISQLVGMRPRKLSPYGRKLVLCSRLLFLGSIVKSSNASMVVQLMEEENGND